MASHNVKVIWKREGATFDAKTYNRDHVWEFEGGETLNASAAPDYLGNPDLVDPEQAFTASLSSCHMLFFLALAANKGFVINSYSDDAEGFLGKNEQGRMAMVRVVLRPRIEFEGEAPSEEMLKQLNERAHKMCFIANSVNCQIDIE